MIPDSAIPDPVSRLEDLARIQSRLAGLPPHFPPGIVRFVTLDFASNDAKYGLYGAVSDALNVLPPPGSPESVRRAAHGLAEAAAQCATVAAELRALAAADLPAAWAGAAAELGAGAVGALSAQDGTMRSVLQQIADILFPWSDHLAAWQNKDQKGMQTLQSVKDIFVEHFYGNLGSDVEFPSNASYEEALSKARQGVEARIDAATAIMTASGATSDKLAGLPGMLHAAPLADGNVTPLAAVVKAAAMYAAPQARA